jgi:TetR/AcrR family tetracycline transcriptional repressor
LCDSGFSAEHALYALSTVGHFTLGSVLEQQEHSYAQEAGRVQEGAPMPSLLQAAMVTLDKDQGLTAFYWGLEAILLGLAQNLTV